MHHGFHRLLALVLILVFWAAPSHGQAGPEPHIQAPAAADTHGKQDKPAPEKQAVEKVEKAGNEKSASAEKPADKPLPLDKQALDKTPDKPGPAAASHPGDDKAPAKNSAHVEQTQPASGAAATPAALDPNSKDAQHPGSAKPAGAEAPQASDDAAGDKQGDDKQGKGADKSQAQRPQAAKGPVKADKPEKPAEPEKPKLTPEQEEELRRVNSALAGMLSSMARSQKNLGDLEKEAGTAKDDVTKQRATGQLKDLSSELERQRENLQGIAAGLPPDVLDKPTVREMDWRKELEQLMWPIVRELKDLTERPREIDRLRTDIGFRDAQITKIDQALERLRQLRDLSADPVVNSYLDQQRKHWREVRDSQSNQLKVSTLQLEQKLAEQHTLSDSIRQLFSTFFRTRGFNLLFAASSFFFVFGLARYAYGILRRRPQVEQVLRESFFMRLADVTIYAIILIAAIFTALTVLYVSGDWVLLGLTMLLFVGMLWSAKQGLAQFWEQTKLILNVGAVREGERILMNGLPWRVDRLHYYSTLSNPALTGGMLRVRLDSLISMASRPFQFDEPWFPTNEGDFVLLADKTFGRVVRQTPETVQIALFGVMTKTYPTSSYLSQMPQNLSQGFVAAVTFGLDYAHQADITTVIPQRLREAVQAALENAPYADKFKSLSVEFKEAAASSLDLVVAATFDGSAAEYYYAIMRLIQRICVNVSTQNGWNIPFPQMVVHQGGQGWVPSGGNGSPLTE